MPLTLLRQEDDVRPSDAYVDTVAPTEAAYETNPGNLEDNMNHLRSAVNNLLNRNGAGFPSDNWWDDLVAPSALETGTQRGMNAVNDALHLVEKKRTLKCVWNLHTVTIASAGDVGVVLGAGQLPSNTTAVLDATTALGTVATQATTFGTYSATDVVAGATALSPKNLLMLVDSASRDPILDAGDRIYGLLQTEDGTTPHTITAAASTRAQISFVKINGTGTGLVAITSGAMDGVTFDYCHVERVRWEDRTEQDWLGTAEVDVPAGAAVTRQGAYDGQGATVVTTTTNATLDLGTGLFWEIGDDDSAPLLTITEASAGSGTTVALGAQVDVFDVDAVDNDFLNGATFGTTGTGIQIAETAGVIERAADLEIRASGAGELYLDDSNQPVSWAQTAGVKLSDTATEWSDYETAFGGEVSLLNAIVQAANTGSTAPGRLFHVVQANVSADTDVGGPSTAANNLDVNLPDGFVTAGILNTFLYLNGRLMQPGADATANNDYYPGTTFTAGDVEIKFERNVKQNDVLVSLVYAA